LRIFALKVTLQQVTFNCQLQKNIGVQDVLVAPPPSNSVGEATAPSAPLVAAPMISCQLSSSNRKAELAWTPQV